MDPVATTGLYTTIMRARESARPDALFCDPYAPELAGFLAMMAANGSPFQFGTDDPHGFLTGHGWQPAVTRYGDAGANFGRWIMPPGYQQAADSAPRGFLVVAHR